MTGATLYGAPTMFCVPSPLLTRFDLMFVTREREEREEIANVAGHIIDNHDVEVRDHRGLDVDDSLRESVEGEVEADVLRVSLAAARQFRRCSPTRR